MAWRAPRYGITHAGRELYRQFLAPPSVVADENFPSGTPFGRLFDSRTQSLAGWTTSAADHWVRFRAENLADSVLDRLWIPAGHNLTGNVVVEEDATSAFSSPTTLLSAAIPSGVVDLDFTPSSEVFVRVRFEATGQWEIPELVLTRTRTPVRGPAPDFQEFFDPNVVEFESFSGARAFVSRGASRWTGRYEYSRVLDSADLALFDDLAALSFADPLLVDPAYDDEPARWVHKRRLEIASDHPNPAGVVGERRAYRLELEESLA